MLIPFGASLIYPEFSGFVFHQGFLDLKMKKWTRNLMTRSIAITPSLVVSIIGGSSGAGRLIIIASVNVTGTQTAEHNSSAYNLMDDV